ncbi:MAG TPA: hypothetical protein VFJ43_14760, partial [Bacteroidia bacterium]|nr:hypothetical protein [Bacteroidia bacterium]
METTKTDIESITNAQQELPKIFRVKAIYGATFLGGPLAAGYIMAHNYKIFGEPGKAKLSMAIAILSTLLLFLFVFNLPSSVKIPNQIIPLFY